MESPWLAMQCGQCYAGDPAIIVRLGKRDLSMKENIIHKDSMRN